MATTEKSIRIRRLCMKTPRVQKGRHRQATGRRSGHEAGESKFNATHCIEIICKCTVALVIRLKLIQWAGGENNGCGSYCKGGWVMRIADGFLYFMFIFTCSR
jgi:hypothetical protein